MTAAHPTEVWAAALGRLDLGRGDLLDGWTVTVTDTCPAVAVTSFAARAVELSARVACPARAAKALAHELGHVVDHARLTATTRAAWMALRGMDLSTPWASAWAIAHGGPGHDFLMPAGDWAEAFAVAATGDASRWRSLLGPPPTATEVGFIREVLAR